MKKLSQPIGKLKDHYQIVIIGSGYGGAIAASRLSRAGLEVCVLERGREFISGGYPNTKKSIKKNIQAISPDGFKGNKTALFDFRLNEDINVFVGCGLGGTSLINKNEAIMPPQKIFEDPVWPENFRKDYNDLISIDFKHAKEMLSPSVYPDSFPKLTKLDALEKIAAPLNGEFSKTPISVNFKEGNNHVGIYQQPCKLCGDCVSGCNHDAKNTLVMNYLPDAVSHGAKVFTRVNVAKIARSGDHWLIFFSLAEYGMERFSAPEMFIRADKIILAAGTMGSSQILFRSRLEENLNLSDCLGEKFSGNINFSGFSYNGDSKINILGYGNKKIKISAPVGPSTTGSIHFYPDGKVNNKVIIQDDTIPGGLVSRLLALSLSFNKAFPGKKQKKSFGIWLRKWWSKVVSIICGPHHGATGKTHGYSSSGCNTSSGRLKYEDGKLLVNWPDLQNSDHADLLNSKLSTAAEVLGGKYINGPLEGTWYQKSPLTYTPLGGCVMAEDSQKGVVNHKSQLFNSRTGIEVYDNLYVMDGSVIPCNLGVSPSLAISAVAERACRIMAQDNGWKINYDLAPSPNDPRIDAKPGFEFSHANRGYFSTQVKDKSPRFEDMKRFFLGEKLGKENNSKIDFILVVDNNDADTFVSSSAHEARLLGTIIAPALSEYPLTVTEGTFNLLVQDPKRPRGRYLYYRYKMVTREGKYYYFDGFRAIRKEKGYDGLWANMSIMYFSIHEGTTCDDPIIGTGILRLSVKEFFTKQLGTLTANNTTDKKEAKKVKKRFFQYFLGTMLKVFRWKIIFPGNNKRRAKDYGF